MMFPARNSDCNPAAMVLLLALLGVSARTFAQQGIMNCGSDLGGLEIAKSILLESRISQSVVGLSDLPGNRLTGSRDYVRAADWITGRLEEIGGLRIYREITTIPSSWTRGDSGGAITAPVSRPLHVKSLGWSLPTPPNGFHSNLVIIRDLQSQSVSDIRQSIAGAVALISAAPPVGEDWTHFTAQQQRMIQTLALAKVAAILLPDQGENNDMEADAATWHGEIAAIPVFQIGFEDSILLGRLAREGPVDIDLFSTDVNSKPGEVLSIFAELPGDDSSAGWIMVGAHLDAWDLGGGAEDDGVGVAMVLDTARVLAALKHRRSKSIRFAFWGGEEQGFLGSIGWVSAHKGELKNVVAYLNADDGAGHPKGWKVEGRSDVAERLAPLRNILAQLDGGGVSNELTLDSDHVPFLLEGVPVLDLWVDMNQYNSFHHRSGDTVDKLDLLDLDADAAILAITTEALACDKEPFAPRLSHENVGQLLDRSGTHKDFVQMLGWKF